MFKVHLLLYRLTSFFILTHYAIISQITNDLSKTAYCDSIDRFDTFRHHPIAVPEHHLPWIWDSVYDPITRIVELTTMNRIPCRFRYDQWYELLTNFPDHRHQMAFGKESNILVPVDPNITIDEEFYLLHSTVICEYLDHSMTLVASSTSLVIRGKIPFTSLGTLQIRCPVPKSLHSSKWQRIRLRLNANRQSHTTKVFANVTAAVPVCGLSRYNPQQKRFKLAACTATNRYNRAHLVEWIEYHHLVGIDHFFIYDTNLHNRTALRSTLHDYIDENIVTVVPWHYVNCVRNMAGGRWSVYRIQGQTKFFQSPRAIAQSAALSSCYSRFKHTTKYMTHIDDDEFLTFSESQLRKNFTGTLVNLYDVSEAIFAKNPRSTSIRFEPVLFWPCNITDSIERLPYNAIAAPPTSHLLKSQKSPLPRVGVWDLSEKFHDSYECKLIMRTDAVGMYFVHFISLVEEGPWERSRHQTSITLSLKQLSVLHYKYPASLSRTGLEGELPMTKTAFEDDCKYWRRSEYAGRVYHAQIPYVTAVALKQRYLMRMSIA